MSPLVPNASAINRSATICRAVRHWDFDPRYFWTSSRADGISVGLRPEAVCEGTPSHLDVERVGQNSIRVLGGVCHYDAIGARRDLELTCDGGPAGDLGNHATLNIVSNATPQYVVLRVDDPYLPTSLTAGLRASIPYGEDGEARTEFVLARIDVQEINVGGNMMLAVTDIEQNFAHDWQYTYDPPVDNCSLQYVLTGEGESESSEAGQLWQREIYHWHNAADDSGLADTDLFLLKDHITGCAEYGSMSRLKEIVNALIDNACNCDWVDDCIDNYDICDKVEECNYLPNHSHKHVDLSFADSEVGIAAGSTDHDYDYFLLGGTSNACYAAAIGYGTDRPRSGDGSGSLRIDLEQCQLSPDANAKTLDWLNCWLRHNGANSVDWQFHFLSNANGHWEVSNGTELLLSDPDDAVNSANFASASLRVAGGAEVAKNVAMGGWMLGNGVMVHCDAADMYADWTNSLDLRAPDVKLAYGPTPTTYIGIGDNVVTLNPGPDGAIHYDGAAGIWIADWVSAGGVIGADVAKYYVYDEDNVRIEVLGRPAV